jgi:type II secretory pathway component GspD/PulD (secretin)
MRTLAALLRGFFFVLLITSAAAQNGPLVSNVFQDTDLRQAIADVAAQANVNIIADPSVSGLVSVELKKVTVDKALDLLLAGTGYQVQKKDDYYLVFNPDENATMFPSVAGTRTVAVHYLPADTARGLLPNPLQKYVRSDPATNVLAITAPRDIADRILSDLATIDVPALDQSAFVALNYVKAATARTLLPEDMQRYVRVDSERNTLAITAPLGSRDEILQQIARLDVPRQPGSFDVPDAYRTKVVKLENARAVATLALLPESLRTFVRADEESNTLAVSAPPVLLPGLLKDIAAIDVERRHIMLDAKVVVLERQDLLNFGAGWKWPELKLGASLSDLPGVPWELRIGYSPDREFTNALSLTLNLLSQNDEATIIASPQVLAQDGRKAEIRVTTEEYFPITAQAGTITYVQSQLQKIETGTILGITPQVGPDGKLTLDMEIEVSDVVARGDQGLPVVSRRIAKSTVQIENGGTAAVAGLVNTRSQTGQSGVPGSNSVPLLGHAFRTDTLNHRAQQVAVFVTATIVDEGSHSFETGRSKLPPAVPPPDPVAFRSDLEAALDRLQQ